MAKDGCCELIAACMRAKLFHIREFLKTLFRYYRDPLFWHVDMSLLWEYFTKSPYKICRELTLQNYGETPFSVWEDVVALAEITKEDRVVELGSGRGRGCFWLERFVGCPVHGIEIIPYFVKMANKVKEEWKINNVVFTCEDLFLANLEEYSVIYLFGTELAEEDITTLAAKFEKLKKGTRIVTISYSLPEIVPGTTIQCIKEKAVRFPWGETTAFLHVIDR